MLDKRTRPPNEADRCLLVTGRSSVARTLTLCLGCGGLTAMAVLAVTCVGWVLWLVYSGGGGDPREPFRGALLGAAIGGVLVTTACLLGNRPFYIGGAPLKSIDEVEARGVAVIRVGPHEEEHAEAWQKGWVLVIDRERAITVPILAMKGSSETLGSHVRLVARPGGGLSVLAEHGQPIGVTAQILDDRVAAWATAATSSMIVNIADMPAALREACLRAAATSAPPA